MTDEALLTLDGLSLRYATRRGPLAALDDVSFSIPRGTAMGLVGESGSGKSSVVLAVLGLLGEGAAVQARAARFDGQDLFASAPELQKNACAPPIRAERSSASRSIGSVQ